MPALSLVSSQLASRFQCVVAALCSLGVSHLRRIIITDINSGTVVQRVMRLEMTENECGSPMRADVALLRNHRPISADRERGR